MISDWLRKRTQRFLVPLVAAISRTGLTPDALTVIGFLLNLVVAGVLAAGHWRRPGRTGDGV
jgi:hypothetical protein